jgi:phosphatidate cytidylyltransferase
MINFLKDHLIWNLIIAISALTFVINSYFVIFKHSSLFNKGNLGIRTFIYLALPFLGACYLLLSNETFNEVLLGVFIIIWLNDAGAYFVGKAIGKHKISPKVSPGKSWEGWIGGIIIGALSTLIISAYLSDLRIMDWLIIAIIVGVMGLIGDLVESSWKRKLGIKDSGTLMPGHGGFLDRLDSFIYSIPFVALYLLNFAN